MVGKNTSGPIRPTGHKNIVGRRWTVQVSRLPSGSIYTKEHDLFSKADGRLNKAINSTNPDNEP